MIEQELAIVCACLPTFKPLVAATIPWARKMTTKGSSQGSKFGPTSSFSRTSGKNAFGNSKSGDDMRLVDGSYLELGENKANETVIKSQRLDESGESVERDPSGAETDTWKDGQIMKTVGVKVTAC